MTKAIIFDFFGVVCPDLYWTWLRDHDADIKGQKEFFQGLANKLDLGKINPAGFAQALSEKTGVDQQKIMPQLHGYISVDQNIVGLISELKKDYKIGLLSNSRASIIDEILTKNNLVNFFDAIVVSEKVGYIKPQREIFDAILENLKLAPSEVVFIDDREKNTRAAENMGIKAILFTEFDKLKGQLKEVLNENHG